MQNTAKHRQGARRRGAPGGRPEIGPEGMIGEAAASPHDEEAEASVLGAIMLADRWFEIVRTVGLEPEDFYRPRHRRLFAEMIVMAERGQPIDTLTAAAALAAVGDLEEAGGRDYIETLVTRIPSLGNTKSYAVVVKENSLLRGLLGMARELQESITLREGSARELLDHAQAKIEELGTARRRAAATSSVRMVASSAPAWSIGGKGTR